MCEGGAIYVAEKDGKYLVITDECAAISMLSAEDAQGFEPVNFVAFATEAERDSYLAQKYRIQPGSEPVF